MLSAWWSRLSRVCANTSASKATARAERRTPSAKDRCARTERANAATRQRLVDESSGLGCSLAAYFDTYNRSRLHQSLDYRTPDEIHFAGRADHLAAAA